jgi:hypothetical protein
VNIPEGYKLVPIDPTSKMLSRGDLNFSWNVANIYKAMLDAAPDQPQPDAHLAIPGALEWDGDNGTHGADGESRAHGEHDESTAAVATLKALGYTHAGGTHWKPPVGQKPDFDLIDQLRADLALERHTSKFWMDAHGEDLTKFGGQIHDLRAQLANTEQSRRSFFDLSQDLEKRLAERDARLEELEQSEAESGIATKLINKWVNDHCQPIPWDKCIEIIAIITKMSDEEKRRLLDLGDDAPQDSAEPTKPKTCIECDQPYCHGVCVERGDQDYDRDQAAKGGDQ